MRPESVEIKVSLAGPQVASAPATLGLVDAKHWSVVFCEDVTAGSSPNTPLLDLGVVLRARGKGGLRGDSTVKLRPCRWSQLAEDFAANREVDGDTLKIEADWAVDRRSLAASMTNDWDDGRLARIGNGDLPLAGLFSDGQRRFLERCAPGRVNLAAVSPLATVAATRWGAVAAPIDGVRLSVRGERWVVGDLDFLELSVVSSVGVAARDQQALTEFVARHGLEPDTDSRNKTQRVVAALVAEALDQ
jgi:hypothetical protein